MVSDAVRLRDRLVEAARAGEPLDVSDETDREIPATAIRALLFGLDAEELDPRGVRLRGAHVTGQLDLTDVRAAVPLVLTRCEFDEGITATRAHLPHLDLSESRFPHLDADDSGCEHDTRLHRTRCEWVSLVDADLTGDLTLHGARLAASDTPALDLAGATIGGDLYLDDGFTASSDSHGGTLRLLRATIGETLHLSEAKLTAINGPALFADNLTVSDNVFLNESFSASSDSQLGTVRLPGAHIAGQLNLSGAQLRATNGPALHADGLALDDDLFLSEEFSASSDSQLGTVRLPGAYIAGQLSLSGAQLRATNGPALNGEYFKVDNSVFLDDGFSASSDSDDGTLRFSGASITGQLSLRGAQLRATNGPALHADGLRVSNGLFLRKDFVASSDSSDGTLRFSGASITGQLSLRGAQLRATNGPSLNAERITVGNNVFLDDGFSASSDSQLGTLRLSGAHIAGQLSLSGAQLRATNGPALNGEYFKVDNSVFLDDGFSASSDSSDGTLRLSGAHIAGQLNLSGARLTATHGTALHADNLTVGNNVFLNESFSASSDSSDGTLRLSGAHIAGQLNLSGAQLRATNGPALNADGLRVSNGLFLRKDFVASSDSSDGTLRLLGAHITGQLSLRGAQLRATNGPSLNAERITVGNNVFLDESFSASSDSSDGTLRFSGAHITGQLSLSGARLTATNGPALQAESIAVGDSVFLDDEFTATSDSNDGTLRLDGAEVSGDLFVDPASVSNTGQNRLVLDLQSAQVSGDVVLPLEESLAESEQQWRVAVDGLRYPFIPRAGTYHHWLRLLREHTVKYAAQPYQQLAGVYRAAGHDREAREILIAQQRDLRHRGELEGWLRRLLHRLSGAFIGYGHRPFRALGYLAGLCTTTVGLVLLANLFDLAVRAHPNTGPCSIAETIGLGIDTAVPLLKTGSGQRCEIATTNTWGQALYLGNYLLTILGWAFATLFVAGYTGLIRKNT